MIFVTVGTHHQPFTRLLDALDALPGDDLVVQFGPGRPPRGVAEAAAYFPFDRMLSLFAEAEKVITHAGVGSILCARRAGQTPLVVPRRHDLGEHVDEHQAELTRALAGQGVLIEIVDVSGLGEAVAAAPSRRPSRSRIEPALCPAVRGALLGQADISDE